MGVMWAIFFILIHPYLCTSSLSNNAIHVHYFSFQEIDISIFGIGVSLVDNTLIQNNYEILYMSISSSGNYFPYNSAVWKFHDFSCHSSFTWNQFRESRSSKTAIFANFGALKFVNLVNISLQKLKKCKNFIKTKFRASICVKMADFALLESPKKLISRKIWVIEKSWNFHTVKYTT